MRIRHRFLVLLAVLTLLLPGACSKDQAVDNLLAYVPADSPYVIANLQPLDPEFRRSWLSAMGGKRMLEVYKAMLSDIRAEAKTDEERKSIDLASAMLGELEPLFDPQVATPLGLAERSEFAMYGYGLLPVLRMRLADPLEFEATIARMEKAAGEVLPTVEVAGNKVRRKVIEQVALYLAIIGDQLVMTLIPQSAEESLREEVLGLRLPEQSMADGGVLKSAAERYQLVGSGGVGIVDSAKLLSALLQPSRPGDKALMALGKDSPTSLDIDPVCSAEVEGLAAHLPRMVMGATRMEGKAMDTLGVFELAPELAKAWAGVSAGQPGGQAPKDGLAWFGFGIDPVKSAAQLRSMADKVSAAPYQCAHLSDLNQSMAEMKEGLNPMVVGMAANFTGMFVNLDKIEFGDSGTPTGGEGVVALSSPAPAAVWAMAKAQLTELEALDLGVDKGVVAVPAELLPLPVSAKALMTAKSLAVAIGEVSDERLTLIAQVDTEGAQPIMRYGFTGRFYSEFYGKMMEQAILSNSADYDAMDDEDEWSEDEQDGYDSEDENADDVESEEDQDSASAEQKQAMAKNMTEMMSAFGDSIEYMDVRVVLTENGVEMRQEMRLK